VSGGPPFGIREGRSWFATTVLEQIRSAGVVRALLGLGAILSVCGSVGLHPEPVTRVQFCPEVSGERLGCPQPAAVSHACLICLLHARVSLSWVSVVAKAVEPVATRLCFVQAAPLRAIDSSSFDGRGPPGSR
jgi:hypothetical protein